MKKIHLMLVVLFAFAVVTCTSGVASAYLSREYVGNTMVDLSWTQYESTDFSKYELYRNGSLINTIRDRTDTFYRDTGLTKGHTYIYEIRSYYTTDKYRSDTTSATTGEVHGTITRDTAWTAASSPYTLTKYDMEVRNGATLTIESGVMVTTVLSYCHIAVEEKGALYADSVSFSGVILIIHDDSHADIKNCSFELSQITVRDKGALYADGVSFSGVSLIIHDDSHADIKNCSFVNDGGISLSSSNNNVITGNTLSNSSTFSIILSDSENNVITGNTVSNNKGGGIILVSSSSNNTITDNNVSNNGHGIDLSSSSNNTITGNIATNNEHCGIDLGNSSNNIITNNNVSNNDWFGIMFCGFCNNNTIKNNIANNNKGLSGIGFLAGYCYGESINNNTIKNNIANNNGHWGVDISGSCNTVTGNNVGNNSLDGILLYNSNNNNITNNTASNNSCDGIYLYNSSNNNISDNIASNNNDTGIWLDNSSNNVIANNTVSNNNDTGIFLDNSSANTIYNNYFNNTENAYDNGNNTWNITKTTGTNIVGGPYLGGNYWCDYAGEDLDGDKLGDTLLPYNCSGGIENGGDYHPLIREGVSGHKFNDINGDGVWGPIEPPLANWTITLEGTAEDWSKVSLTTTTNENGSYKFEDVPRGDYTLSEIPEAGWIQTWPAHLGTYSVIIITNNDVKGKNFGNRRFWVSGHKFNDTNGDGVWDPTEPPLANWTIKLEGTAEDESNVSLTTTTDENGSYKFEDVPKGNYTLSEVLMSGWNQTLPSAPGIYTVTITNADERNKDFGNHRFIGTRDYVIVGAPGERVGDNETQGRAYVFYGSTDMLHHTLSTPNPIAGANFGWSVCTGDVGGDYLEEVIVGAPGEHVGENIAQGRAYVFYGSTDMLRHTLNTSNPIANASFGWSVCTGDVNCDGFDEIIVGAPGERVRDNEAQGRAYVFYGSTGTLRHTLDTPNPISDASFGWSVCTGDVNCDGFEEVIVGAPGERVGDNEAQGRVYVFNGSTGTLRYTMDTPNPQPEASFGWSVCTGDVNCDGFEEVIVGAPGERVGDNKAQGQVYVFNGSTGTLRYTMDTPNPQPEASFGWSVCTGDVNCNGFEEVIVGAPGERVGDNKAQGRAYVFYGSMGTLHHTMDTPNPQSDALFGRSVCTGATSPP